MEESDEDTLAPESPSASSFGLLVQVIGFFTFARSKILIAKVKKASGKIQSHSVEDDNDDRLPRGNGKGG